MFFFFLSYFVQFLFEAILVGGFVFVLLGEKIRRVSYKKGILLVLPFAILQDVIFIPAMVEADLSVKIGNQALREMLGLSGEYKNISSLISIGWLDLGTWILSSVIAYFSGHTLYDQTIQSLKRRVV